MKLLGDLGEACQRIDKFEPFVGLHNYSICVVLDEERAGMANDPNEWGDPFKEAGALTGFEDSPFRK